MNELVNNMNISTMTTRNNMWFRKPKFLNIKFGYNTINI